MNFYYVDDENKAVELNGGNQQILEAAIKAVNREKYLHGMLSAIDSKGKLRASLLYYKYDNRINTKVRTFIRKYAAIAVLENIANARKIRYDDDGG